MTTGTLKTALITGGAKRIGRAITESLATDCWAVAIHYFGSSDEASTIAQSINHAGGRAAIFAADLSNPNETAGLIQTASEILGPIGALINNASLFEAENWNDVTIESWTQHLSINLQAPFLLSQAFARALPESTEGAIVNVIDQRVFNLTPDYISYTISKTGLWTLTRTLALALAPRIRVNGVGPWPTLPNARQSQETFLKQAEATPLKRKVELSEITSAVKYLLAAQAVTGQMIAVDSGEHLGWAQPVEGHTHHG